MQCTTLLFYMLEPGSAAAKGHLPRESGVRPGTRPRVRQSPSEGEVAEVETPTVADYGACGPLVDSSDESSSVTAALALSIRIQLIERVIRMPSGYRHIVPSQNMVAYNIIQDNQTYYLT